MEKYLDRYLDIELEDALGFIGAVLIVGPKWCGKTTTAKQIAKSVIELQDPDYSDSYLKLADVKPSKLLEGDKPRLIDEWQMAPQLWDAVRHSVDKIGGEGLYILTGSTVVDNSKIKHSGTGRIHSLLMRPMSLYESKDSNGMISLIELFNNPQLNIDGISSDLSLEDLVFVTCRGGWPESINKKNKNSQLKIAKSYFKNICDFDVSDIDGVNRDPDKVRYILKSYARNVSTSASNSKILLDIEEHHGVLSTTTYYEYINALKRLFVIDDVPAWSTNIRSAKTIRKAVKKQFIDPSIAVAALNLSPDKLFQDFNTFGFIFENLCVRDLNVYSSYYGGEVTYYNDSTGLEVDCILTLENGQYALIEFKTGIKEEEKGAKNLLKLQKLIKDKIESGDTKIPEPTFLAIINGGEMAYTRKDGVKVIPIGCLKQ